MNEKWLDVLELSRSFVLEINWRDDGLERGADATNPLLGIGS